jgi:hypothetical protein
MILVWVSSKYKCKVRFPKSNVNCDKRLKACLFLLLVRLACYGDIGSSFSSSLNKY